jgi:hypothetical protein
MQWKIMQSEVMQLSTIDKEGHAGEGHTHTVTVVLVRITYTKDLIIFTRVLQVKFMYVKVMEVRAMYANVKQVGSIYITLCM